MINQCFSSPMLGMLIFNCYMLTDPAAGWPLQVRTCLVTYSKHDHNPRNRQLTYARGLRENDFLLVYYFKICFHIIWKP